MAIVTLGKDTSGRTLRLDDTFITRLRHAEKQMGFTLVIIQGSYVTGTKASANTHDKGGVADFRSRTLTTTQRNKALTELRKAGLIAWYRTKAQGFDPHIHAVERASKTLSASAARQVTAFLNGRNGLASNGADDGPKVTVPTALPGAGASGLRECSLGRVVEQAKAKKKTPSSNVFLYQEALRDAGYPTVTDGLFESQTKDHTARWQKSLGYSGKDADGIPGWTSFQKLGNTTKRFKPVQKWQ